jgi:hypothetical protein
VFAGFVHDVVVGSDATQFLEETMAKYAVVVSRDQNIFQLP